jgi:hypothetical protein
MLADAPRAPGAVMGRGLAGTVSAVVAVGLLAAHAPSAGAGPDRLRAAWAAEAIVPAAGGGAAVLAEDEALNRIIAAVQRRYNARVVRVTEVTVKGRRCYDLRLLSEQRVWVIRVDAATGQEIPGSD